MERVKVASDLPISNVVYTCRFEQNYWQNILISWRDLAMRTKEQTAADMRFLMCLNLRS